MALNRWQARYRWFQFRFPRIGVVWRWLAWKAIAPRAPRNIHWVEPFPKWYGMSRAEEEWAKDLIERHEEGADA